MLKQAASVNPPPRRNFGILFVAGIFFWSSLASCLACFIVCTVGGVQFMRHDYFYYPIESGSSFFAGFGLVLIAIAWGLLYVKGQAIALKNTRLYIPQR